MNSKKKECLADNIAELLSTTPGQFDIDDTDLLQPNQISLNTEEDPEEEEILSKFRTTNVDLLEDIDEKYAGRKTTRKSLKTDESSESENEEEEESGLDSDDGQVDDDNDTDNEVNSGEDIEEESDGSDNSEQDEDEEEESDGSDNSEHDEDEDAYSDIDDNDNFKTLKNDNISNQVKKAQCVRNQMSIWESLLEARIQLQKCLSSANKMPNGEYFSSIKTEFGNEFLNPISEVKKQLTNTLDKMLNLQTTLLKKYPETKNFENKNKNQEENAEEDEEISSDTDVEEEDDTEKEESEEVKSSKKRKLEDFEIDIDKQFKVFKPYWNSVIQKWNDKTRIASKHDGSSHSVLNQIEYNLTNKDKLIKKTQLKRTQYRILGEPDIPDDDRQKSREEYNPEIFDDDDFYHQLLRELIEFKSSDITDPVQLGRQWIQLQNLRSKMKRKIDTRATKGRKIRYAVHSKLVNFMAPIDENLWTDEAKTELYNSLFGKNQPAC